MVSVARSGTNKRPIPRGASTLLSAIRLFSLVGCLACVCWVCVQILVREGGVHDEGRAAGETRTSVIQHTDASKASLLLKKSSTPHKQHVVAKIPSDTDEAAQRLKSRAGVASVAKADKNTNTNTNNVQEDDEQQGEGGDDSTVAPDESAEEEGGGEDDEETGAGEEADKEGTVGDDDVKKADDANDVPDPREATAARIEAGEVAAEESEGKNAPPDAVPAGGSPIATVAYAVSVTGCGSDPITEGGAVLKHAIHRVSSRSGASKYDYALFAIYHPSAEACAKPLEKVGYTLLKRDVFVKVSDIRGEFLRTHIEKNGCCGEKELIKLEAYTLTDYPIVVHLDLDVLVLKPMDDLFDLMLQGTAASTSGSASKPVAVMWPEKPLPHRIDAFYTYDYNMVGASNPRKPVQGGFLVARPNQTVYEEFRQLVLEGDFRQGHGWGGLVGPFHGSMTFQGLVPYYYDVLHPGNGVELSRCVYNQMADNPRDKPTVADVVNGNCRTGQDECEDCRSRPITDVVTAHFTLCQKPWWCLPHSQDQIQHRLCRQLTHVWYQVRSELEVSWGRSGYGSGDWERDQFYGYCKFSGHKGYEPIQEPYGATAVAAAR